MAGRIAFIRHRGGRDELRIGDTTSGSKGSRLLLRKRTILNPELSITHIVYSVTGPGPISDEGAQFMRIRNLRTGADRQIYRAVSGGANAAGVTRPAYVASPQGFVWARTNNGSGTGNRIIRYTLRGSKLSYAKGSPFYNSTAWVNNLLGAVTASSLTGEETQGACVDRATNYCKVELTGPLEFDLKP